MKIKLNNKQYQFLKTALETEEPDLFNLFRENTNLIFEIDDEAAEKIRDWAGKKLQQEGFDINYELNETGVILEQFVDMFYL